MKSILVAILLGSFSAAVVGCTASASVDPNTTHTTSTSGDDYSKKTVTRDANGNVTETKVEKKAAGY